MAKPKRLNVVDVDGRPEVSAEAHEDVSVVPIGNGKWRVETALFEKRAESALVLEEAVSLPVARARAQSWRARNGGIARGLP